MAIYTDANGVKLITTGDEAGTWGSSTNVNMQILDRAANGFESIALTSTSYTLTLSAQPSSAEDGHYKAIKFTGSPGGTCTVTLAQNDKARVYMILNSTNQELVITQGSGANVTIEVGKGSIVLADGAGSGAAVTDFTAAVQNVTDLSSPFNVGATSVTATGAELNLLDGAAAATVVNSKTVVYGAAGQVNATTLQIGGANITATAVELNYVDGVTSAIQPQIDAKQPLGTVAVTVSNPGAGNRYYIDGSLQQTVEIKPSVTYRFDQSDGSNASHPLKFSTTSDGTHGGGSPFTTGVTVVGTAGSAGAYTQVKLEQDAPVVLYYYCVNHSGMGGKAVVRMSDLTASRALTSDAGGDIAVSAVTTTELGYLDGVTSAIQTQIDGKQATITGAATTIDDSDLTASRAVISNSSGKVAVSDVTATELGYLDGVTSAIQTQIGGKQATITGAATTIDDTDLTASRAVISNSSGKVAVSDVTDTELGYLDGVTSAIQTQLGGKQATITGAATTIDDTDLTASRAVISNASGKVAVSAVTDTELGHVSGVTSAIQTQLGGKQATITGAATTIDDTDLTASRAVISNASGKVAVSAVTDTELGHVSGVTSAIQTQLGGKQATITGAATTIDDTDLTASRVLVSNSSGKVAASTTTTTALGNFIDGSSLNASNLDSGTVNDARLPASISSDITGNAATATTAGTVTTAAQTNITSLGTLTELTVDSVTINGSVVTASILNAGTLRQTSAGADISIETGGALFLKTDTQATGGGIVHFYDSGTERCRFNLDTADRLSINIGSSPTEEMRLTKSGVNVINGLRVGDTTAPTDNDIHATADISANGVFKLTSGASDWSLDVDSNHLFLKYGGLSQAKIPYNNGVVAYLGDQSSSTWTTGTGTTESVISPAKLKSTVDNQFNITGSAPAFAVRAFVKFAGNGSNSANQTISASGNVATVFKNSSGNFTVTFDTAMPDEHYCITYVNQFGTTARDDAAGVMDVYAQSASAFSFTTADASSNSYPNYVGNFITIVR